jgi:hypothetical protein
MGATRKKKTTIIIIRRDSSAFIMEGYQTDSGVHPVSSPMGIGGSFLEGKANGS